MPVTASLSKAFYDRLGEQITNEIVDWFNSVDTELREHNDQQWSRFEAKLEAALKSMKSELLTWMFAFWATTMLSLVGLLFRISSR
jgi:hypothetical protein